MQNFSTNAKIVLEAIEKIGDAIRRDVGEIEHLQASIKGAQKFAERSQNRFVENLVYLIQKMRPKYSISVNDKLIFKGADIAHTFLIQSISGEKSFLHGVHGFKVLVALKEQKDVIIGLIYDPMTDEIFISEKGKGTFLYHPYRSQRLRISSRENPVEMLLATTHFDSLDEKYNMHLSDQVGAFIVGISGGKYDAFFGHSLTETELEIAKLFTTESGGKYTEKKDFHLFSSINFKE